MVVVDGSDTTWGMKSHIDKISVSRKQVLLHFSPKITGVKVQVIMESFCVKIRDGKNHFPAFPSGLWFLIKPPKNHRKTTVKPRKTTENPLSITTAC